MTLSEFIAKYEGQTKGYPTDANYHGECLSLVKLYIKECFGLAPPPSGSNSAYGYWSNFPAPLGTVFEKVVNSPSNVPKTGDIPIWNTNAGGGYGHIDIFISGDANNFTGFDQNWNGRQAHKQAHNYTNVVGWLHPKGTTMSEQITIDKATFENLVTKATKYDAFVSAGWNNPDFVNQTIADYRKSIEDLKGERDLANRTVEERRKEWNELIAYLAQELGTRQDIQEIKDVAEKYDKVLGDLQDTKTHYAADRKTWGEKNLELDGEIARLKALVNQSNVLENAKMEELLREIVKRLLKIVRIGE